MFKTLSIICTSLILMVFVACDGFQTSALSSAELAQVAQGPVDGIRITAAQATSELNLSAEQKLTFQVASQEGYAGTVVLDIDRTDLDVIDTQQAVELSLDNRVVQLTAGSSTDIELTIKTKSSAPSFEMTDFKITAVPSDEKSNPAEMGLQVKVNPVVEVQLLGRNDVVAERMNQPMEMDFLQHAVPLTVRFVNKDTTEGHIVHGNASIMHGDRGNPLTPSVDGIQDGGVYTVQIPTDEDRVGTYYYHNFEGNGQRRTMRFNQTPAQVVQVQGLRSLASVAKVETIPELEAEKGEHANCHGGK